MQHRELRVECCWGCTEPSLNGQPLALDPYEPARSLAVAPDGRRFVLGTEWSLRLFDQAGKSVAVARARRAWAVNVSGDGRLVVAAYGDGTIRWHRRGDGRSYWPSTRTRTGSAGCCGRRRATTTPRPGRRT